MNGTPHVRTSTSKRGSCACAAATNAREVEARVADAGEDQQPALDLRRRRSRTSVPQSKTARGPVGRRRGGADEQQAQGSDGGTGGLQHGAQYRKGSDFPSLFVITGRSRTHSVSFFATLAPNCEWVSPRRVRKMAQVGLLVTELKRHLKAQGITYAALSKQLGLQRIERQAPVRAPVVLAAAARADSQSRRPRDRRSRRR